MHKDVTSFRIIYTVYILQFIDISSVDTETFVNIVRVTEFPPLPDYYEKVIRKDVTNIINKYMKNNDLKGDSHEIIEFFERLVKFVALYVSAGVKITK